MILKKATTCAAFLALVSTGFAQDVHLNEIYGRHVGNDDQEMIELIGTPGTSLDNVMVLLVEGEVPNAGVLDRAWDLTGLTIPPSGFFVLGVNAVAPLDYSIGNSNRIESGTQTVYLVNAPDPSALTSQMGSDLDDDDDGVTVIPSLSTIIDLIAIIDNDYAPGGTPHLDEEVFDGAATLGPLESIGPDLSYFPAGVFRQGDYPNAWCTDTWLDFDDVTNTDQPRTPGASNSAVCGGGPASLGIPFCSGDGSGAVACPCGNTGNLSEGCAHSGGYGMTISASGSLSVVADNLIVTAENCPVNNSGIFYCGQTPIPNGQQLFDGLQCASGNVRRFQGVFQAAGTASDTGFVAQDGTGYFQPAFSYAFQFWTRDVSAPSACGTNANFSPGLWITMTP